MAHNRQFDFRLKVDILKLQTKSKSTANTTDSQSSSSQLSSAATAVAATAPSKITRSVAMVNRIDYEIHTLDTFEIWPSDIEYRAEGNANIVLALPQRCQVLRLPKCQQQQRDSSSGRDQNICRSTATAKKCSQNERIFYVYKYIAGVSALFDGRSGISTRPILVRIEIENIDTFNEWLHNHRPNHRLKSPQQQDHFVFNYGLLYHDACCMRLSSVETQQIAHQSTASICNEIAANNVLSVEIKPKQGWNICRLPESLLKLMDIQSDVQNRCRFCTMQYLKVKGHQVNEISKYCPLDLFSGDVPRMKKSICNLIATPQNNFRVFHNGHCVYADEHDEHDLVAFLTFYFGNDSKNIDNFIMLLINILQHEFPNNIHQTQQLQTTTASVAYKNAYSADIHPHPDHSTSQHRSILKDVLDLQLLAKKTMPYVAQKYLNDKIGWDALRNNPPVDWPHLRVVELCQKLSQINDGNTIDVVDYDNLKSACNLSDEEMYEIGATALDCSIMLTIQRAKNEMDLKTGFPTIKLNGVQFNVNATVFDMDPKPYQHHFTKYVKKTKDSFNAYKQSLIHDASR